MATIEETLKALVIGDTAVNAIISGRCYMTVTPDNPTLPCISYQRINTLKDRILDGGANFTEGLFQFDIWFAKTGGALGSVALARKLQTALNEKRGTFSSVDVQAILFENEQHGYEPDVEMYRVTQQYTILFRE